MAGLRSGRRQLHVSRPLPVFILHGNSLFDRLPVEILQQIGLEYEQNEDLLKFASICRATFNALERDDKHFWRRRFLASFDPPDWPDEPDNRKANARYKSHYQERQALLLETEFVGFPTGYDNIDAMPTLRLLRDLMFEAEPQHGRDAMTSKNLGAVVRFIHQLKYCKTAIFSETDIDTLEANPEDWRDVMIRQPMLQMVQCLLAPLLLNDKTRWTFVGFFESQAVVYASPAAEPMFLRDRIHFGTVLHHINFWACHFLKDKTSILVPWYADLPMYERPAFWTAKLSTNISSLDGVWKGTYAYLDNEEYFRHSSDDESHQTHHLQDEFPGDGSTTPFQDFELQQGDVGKYSWPDAFSNLLPFDRIWHDVWARDRAWARAQGQDLRGDYSYPEPKPISGRVSDQGEQFLISGWVTPVPSQMEVPGWQLIFLIKYCIDEDTRVIDDEAIWVYHGVVFPGSRLVVGCWWCPSTLLPRQEAPRGPFIMWATSQLTM